MFAVAARAQAAETIYWDNYSAGNVAFANIDGSGGGLLDLGGEAVEDPEGMAYDSATNRLFVANSAGENGSILAVDLDGSGASSFTAPGAPIESPEGVAVDPVSRKIYWANTSGSGSIAWAKLDGTAGGTLNTTGATFEGSCCRIAVDPAGGRPYWINDGATPHGISYANLDNSGGGNLNLTGSTVEPGSGGIAVDSAAGRIYFLGENEKLGYADTDGSGGGGTISTAEAPLNDPYGIAVDPSLGLFYAGNYGNQETPADAIGIINLLNGGYGSITPAEAPVAGPQDPVILKPPVAAGVPNVTGSTKTPASLTCSQGAWASYPGSFVYAEPTSIAYQWSKNGAPIAGANGTSLTATDSGAYACTVTAANRQGSTSQTSAALNVVAPAVAPQPVSAPSRAVVSVKRKAKAAPGHNAVFKVKLRNAGGTAAADVRLCAKLSKKAKRALKGPRCKDLGSLAAGATRTAKLKVKVKQSAKRGSYGLRLLVKGIPGKPVKAKVVVVAPARHHR